MLFAQITDTHIVPKGQEWLNMSETEMQALLADKGSDADYIIAAVGKAQAVIPPRSMRKHQSLYDKELYKERNLVERMFNKLKHFRRVATRYDKLAVTYLAFIHFAAIYLLLR